MALGQIDSGVDSTTVVMDTLMIEAELDAVKVESAVEDSIPVPRPMLSGASIYLDYGKLATIWTNFETKGEIGFLLSLKRDFYLSAEAGYASLSPQSAYSNADYESRGTYYRIGFGFSTALNPKSNIGIGLRYGLSNFEDGGNVKISNDADPLYNDYEVPFSRSNISASWFEIVLGTESQLFERVYLGMFLRLRIMDKYDEQTPIDVYTIPGYGRTFDNSIPAVNLYARYVLFSK